MPRQVDAEDLHLFAVNTGEFYRKHCRMASVPENGWAWIRHVRDVVLPTYCKQVEPVWASAQDVEAVAAGLHEYYTKHLEEAEACGNPIDIN